MTYEKNLRRCINISFGFAILFSLGVSAPMFIVVYPGDECLLFVSVRGEALIYGNPAGCNFIAYGHCIIILAGLILMGYIFIFKRRRTNSLKSPKKGTSSNRTLHGSNSLIQNPGTDEVDWRSPILGKLTQQAVQFVQSICTAGPCFEILTSTIAFIMTTTSIPDSGTDSIEDIRYILEQSGNPVKMVQIGWKFQNPGISFIPSNGALSMQMKPVMPQDQVSLVSNGSSILKSNHHYQQLQPIMASTMPPTPVPGMGAPTTPLPSHNLSQQFNPQSQPMLSSPNPQSNQVQYVQLSNGLLVPMGSASQPNIHANATQNMINPQMQLQNNQINLQCYQTASTASASNLNPQQLMHQQMIQQQLHLQQLQLQQQQQQLISMGASPMGSTTPHPHDFSRSQMSLGVNLQDSDATDVTLLSMTNTKADQKKQIHLSKDAGFKCSQI